MENSQYINYIVQFADSFALYFSILFWTPLSLAIAEHAYKWAMAEKTDTEISSRLADTLFHEIETESLASGIFMIIAYAILTCVVAAIVSFLATLFLVLTETSILGAIYNLSLYTKIIISIVLSSILLSIIVRLLRRKIRHRNLVYEKLSERQ